AHSGRGKIEGLVEPGIRLEDDSIAAVVDEEPEATQDFLADVPLDAGLGERAQCVLGKAGQETAEREFPDRQLSDSADASLARSPGAPSAQPLSSLDPRTGQAVLGHEGTV